MSDAVAPGTPVSQPVAELPQMLLQAFGEICAVIDSLRESRDSLQRSTVSRLLHTTEKLQEVSNATELAATGILDGLDRSLALVDTLESLDASGNADAEAARGQLRDELFTAQAALQFQDITSQQLNYASSILVDMEQRLRELARTLDPAAAATYATAPGLKIVDPAAYDPNATTRDGEVRQALADSIFKSVA